jgi:AraC-like DNA-binding protein
MLRRRRIGSYVFVAHDYPERSERGRHSHDWLHLSIMQRGQYLRTIGGRSRSYRPGSVSLLPTGTSHGDSYAPGSECLHLAVPPQLEQSLLADFTQARADRDELTPAVGAAGAIALFREYRDPNSDSPLVVESVLLDLVSRELALAVERSRCRPSWLSTLLDYLDDTFEQPWTLKGIAEEIGVHPVYMCRAFSSNLHCTFSEYILALRLLRGRQLLLLSRATIADVANESGFADQSHFTRRFKTRFGVTPGRYRRSARISGPETAADR